jgi:hypothetical protein
MTTETAQLFKQTNDEDWGAMIRQTAEERKNI